MLYHGQTPEARLTAVTLGAAHTGFASTLVGHGVAHSIVGTQLYEDEIIINQPISETLI